MRQRATQSSVHPKSRLMNTTTTLLAITWLTAAALPSCQSYNAAMTPRMKVSADDFDGSKVIRQAPVSSSASLTEDWHTLAFNVGGKVITAQPASLTTEYGSSSTRRFSVTCKEFETIATAPLVKMKVSGANSYGVSSFGTSTGAIIGTKFPGFLQEIRASR